MGKYYPSESYWGEDTHRSKLESSWRQKRSRDYGYLYNMLSNSKDGSLLDIGAGDGTFASKFKELGWRVDGVEFLRMR